MRLEDTEIRDNNADVSGGGLSSDRYSSLIMRSSMVTDNTAPNSYGGGMFIGPDTTIELSDVTISGNSSRFCGGLKSTGGQLQLTGCRVVSNQASNGEGGGLCSAGNVAIKNSAIANNTTSTRGGGISFASGMFAIKNSTISDNAAVTRGGGLDLSAGGRLSLTNITITSNRSPQGGGMFITNLVPVLMHSTILAGNISNSGPDCLGFINSEGYNLVGTTNNCSLTQQPTDLLNVNPNLAALADNGGLASTHALQQGSPAIDTGDNILCAADPELAEDQRGMGRHKACDIGSYEYVPCGNGLLDEGEQCDGPDLNGNDCTTIGHDGGVLACRADCTFDDSACIDNPPQPAAPQQPQAPVGGAPVGGVPGVAPANQPPPVGGAQGGGPGAPANAPPASAPAGGARPASGGCSLVR